MFKKIPTNQLFDITWIMVNFYALKRDYDFNFAKPF